MSINFKRDLTSTNFFFKGFKSSKFISGAKVKTSKIVLVVLGLRVDIKF